jgi:hypothetical protein
MEANRLIRFLAIGGLLILALSWWFSFRRYSDFYFSPRSSNWTVSGSFYAATFSVSLNPYDQASTLFSSSSNPPTRFNEPVRDAYGLFGGIGLGRSPTRDCGEGVGHFNYYLDLPIWLLYFAFIGSSFVFVSYFMNRSSRVKEKALAEQGETPQPLSATLFK